MIEIWFYLRYILIGILVLSGIVFLFFFYTYILLKIELNYYLRQIERKAERIKRYTQRMPTNNIFVLYNLFTHTPSVSEIPTKYQSKVLIELLEEINSAWRYLARFFIAMILNVILLVTLLNIFEG